MNTFLKEGMSSFHKQARLDQMHVKALNRERFILDSTINLFALLINYAENLLVEKLNNLPKNTSGSIKNNAIDIANTLEYFFLNLRKIGKNFLPYKSNKEKRIVTTKHSKWQCIDYCSILK